jgi:hypothetical protein
MAKQPGTGGRPSQQVKVVVHGKQYRAATGSGNIVSTPATVGGQNRERINAARRMPPAKLRCVECGQDFEGRRGRLLCGSRRCKDRRYARQHPEELRAKERRKYERRTRRTARAAQSPS